MARRIREKISILVQKRLSWNASLFLWVAFWCASLPPYGIPILAVAAFVFPLSAIDRADRREVLLWTPLWTALFEVATVWWIVPTIHRFGAIPFPVAALLVLMLCAYLGFFSYLFFVLVKILTVRLGPAGICFAPLIWAPTEWLKGRLFGGFSWWGPGYAASMYDELLQNAHVFGVLGLSFLFVMAAASIALLLTERRKPGTLAYSLVAVALLAGAFLHGAYYGKQDLTKYPRFRAGVVQPSIPQDMKWDEGFRGETMERLTGLSIRLSGESPGLLVWPESSIPVGWGQDRACDEKIRQTAKETGVPMLFGTVFSDEKGTYNGAILLDQWGTPSGNYKKTHLVPFGEYVPMEKFLFFASPLVETVGSFEPGDDLSPIDLYGVRLGVTICYEAIFPGLIRKQANSGSDILVNLSNDAWYEGTPAIYQHFLMDRVRAVENFRYMVRSANGGYSAIVDPHGRVDSVCGPGKADGCVGITRIIRERSVYGRFGDLWLAPVLLMFLASFFLPGVRRMEAST